MFGLKVDWAWVFYAMAIIIAIFITLGVFNGCRPLRDQDGTKAALR